MTIGGSTTTTTTRSHAAQRAATSSTWCASYAAAQWWVTRFEACIHDLPVTYILTDAETGATLGEAEFTLDQELELSATLVSIEENDTLTMTGGTGQIAGLAVSVTPSCTSTCGVEAGTDWGGPVSAGTSVEGTVDYVSSVGANQQDTFNTAYAFNFTQPGAVPTSPATSTGPGDLRCDAQVGTSAGCVNTAATSLVTMALSDPSVGQAAAGYLWAQQNLPDHFGTSGHELQRLANPAKQVENRQTICDGTFVRDVTYNADDSCDEFAFASTRQSGAQLGLTGAACAEIDPYQVDGAWYVDPIKATGSERCSRAHVDNTVNGNAGRKLTALAVNQRVLDGDQYQLIITN